MSRYIKLLFLAMVDLPEMSIIHDTIINHIAANEYSSPLNSPWQGPYWLWIDDVI